MRGQRRTLLLVPWDAGATKAGSDCETPSRSGGSFVVRSREGGTARRPALTPEGFVCPFRTQGDPVRIRHSHSPRSHRQYRRSQCSDGERSVLSEVNSKTDLVPPLPVTRSSDAQGAGGATVHQRRNGSKDSLIEEKSQTSTSNLAGKHPAKTIKTIQASRLKTES